MPPAARSQVPIYMLVLNFETNQATSLSLATISGGSIANLWTYTQRYHPNPVYIYVLTSPPHHIHFSTLHAAFLLLFVRHLLVFHERFFVSSFLRLFVLSVFSSFIFAGVHLL